MNVKLESKHEKPFIFVALSERFLYLFFGKWKISLLKMILSVVWHWKRKAAWEGEINLFRREQSFFSSVEREQCCWAKTFYMTLLDCRCGLI